ncbi:conjugal transfer protein TraB [Streptomyces sp. NPDC101393]|uniref:conjugal transfer protein TraB n=1 Tax=Streptomyces sp. NPDC101393 TaxID=3366141 RepID=UPI00380E898E
MGSDLVPYAPQPLARGRRLSFLTIVAQVTALTAQALSLKEGLYMLKRRMEKDSKNIDGIADMCTEAEVETRFTGLINEAAGSLREVAEAASGMASAADHMEANARAFGDAHESEYRAVYEAVQASNVRQAKAGFYRKR